jgi:hypothetical protein
MNTRNAKTTAIVQSNYIPWKGYFDLIRSVDEFIVLDDVQYTRRDWRNRNQIKTPNGTTWLTIPVECKGKYTQKIRETVVSDMAWTVAHWKTIRNFYARASYLREYQDQIEELYRGCYFTYLSDINYRFLTAICNLLNIGTKITRSSDYDLTEGRTDRLLHLCRQAETDVYLSGPAAKAYMDLDAFAQAGIEVRFADYSGYPEYRQLYPPFRHDVSVIDLILNEGPNALTFMKIL